VTISQWVKARMCQRRLLCQESCTRQAQWLQWPLSLLWIAGRHCGPGPSLAMQHLLTFIELPPPVNSATPRHGRACHQARLLLPCSQRPLQARATLFAPRCTLLGTAVIWHAARGATQHCWQSSRGRASPRWSSLRRERRRQCGRRCRRGPSGRRRSSVRRSCTRADDATDSVRW
jgi:hypothetical protein